MFVATVKYNVTRLVRLSIKKLCKTKFTVMQRSLNIYYDLGLISRPIIHHDIK